MDDKVGFILKGAGTLFIKYGIRSISMDDIARELSISKKTLYSVVANKTELVEKLLSHMVENGEYSCLKDKVEGLNAIDILLTVSKMVNSEIKNFNPVITFDLQKYYPVIYREFVMKKREHVFEHIKRNFEQGITEGLYRNDLDTTLVSKLYVQRLIDLHDPDFLSSVDFTFDKIFQVMFENHIRGIANAKGLAYFEAQIQNLNNNTNP